MRTSGILMPIISLSSPTGIGALGKEAYDFVDFLKAGGQTYWQILPIGPTSLGDSPYQSFSAFAFNPYLIDLELLQARGLLEAEDVEREKSFNREGTIDYTRLYKTRYKLLRKAVEKMNPTGQAFEQFKAEQADWLPDYAFFMAIKGQFGDVAFSLWPEAVKTRETGALEQTREELTSEIHFWSAIQYLFYEQWFDLKRYANEKGIKIIGDIPIYVSPDSVELWTKPELFQLDENKNPYLVAGCPPDGFSPLGQLWGNPLYDWDYHKKTGFDWWIKRLKHAHVLYDVIRIDHFRGFAGYYAIPAADENAVNGVWMEGPGIQLIEKIKAEIPGVNIIAEDLGFLTSDVRALLSESGFPGMKILQFAFDSREDNDYLPHNYTHNSVVYTGTHDNTTTADWEQTSPKEFVDFAKEYMCIGNEYDFTRRLVDEAMASVCDTAIIPMQDWLGLGGEARINIPSTTGNNWMWRIKPNMLTNELANRMRRSAQIYGRI